MNKVHIQADSNKHSLSSFELKNLLYRVIQELRWVQNNKRNQLGDEIKMLFSLMSAKTI